MRSRVNKWKRMSSNVHHYYVDFVMRVVENTRYKKVYVILVP